ncbi:MAG: GTP-binding protein [Verrucomicrobiota bacterium]
MVGGFLGAGKTTAIAALAKRFSDDGRRVGLITNDQGQGLVDTQMLRSRGFATEEIAGGCFCCKFQSLVDAARRLTSETRPDLFLAEPVGSCTDLVATVSYPLRRIYGEDYEMAPFSVLVDPTRARRMFGLEAGRGFSPKVEYIYRKQLEEADIIVISKRDLLSVKDLEELTDALGNEFPQARVLSLSSRTGEGFEEWMETLRDGTQPSRAAMQVDYDTYAEGEALLGWLNATLSVTYTGKEEGETSPMLEELMKRVQRELQQREIEIAHLKMTLSPEVAFAGEVAVINLVRTDAAPEFGQELDEPVDRGEIILNLRAEGAPEVIEELVRGAVAESALGWVLQFEHLECFQPGRPVPTHRDDGIPPASGCSI